MPRFVSLSLVVAATLLALLAPLAAAANDYPVVLVHGFGGWGRNELLGFKYWGGNNNDYQGRLHEDGFKNVKTAEIGPFSSNWDRACELYAQIKGGRVDYGPNHAAKHGHARYGRTYPGLFPQWGTVVNGKLQKVHLVGHSMGGQTIRLLAQLLNKGTAGAPIAESGASHPLFTGGKDWVHSVTTVSTPNQGTTLADGMATMIDKVEKALISWFGIGALGGSSVYDAKLDQWAISARKSGESISSYVHRIFSSTFFAATTKDNSRTDLTTAGARALNAWVKTLPNVYYYSISSQDTFSSINFSLKKVQLPNPLTMLLPLQPCGTYMGSRTTVDAGFPESWMANDGQVNVPSQLSDGTGRVVPFAGAASTRGVWNQYATKNYCDHFAITGNSIYYDTFDLFRTHVKVLLNLPAHEQLKRRRLGEHDADVDVTEEEEEEVHEHPLELVETVAETHRVLEERGRHAAVRMCQANKGLTREQSAACGRFLEVMAPGTMMAPPRMLRG